MADTQDIIIPDLGDFSDVEVIEVLVKSGDEVKAEDGLITLETDKATMDVPAPADGVIDTLSVSVGDKVNSGDTIGKLQVAGGDSGDGDDGDSDESGAEDSAGSESSAGDDAASQGGDSDDGASGEDADGGGVQTVRVPDIGDFSDVDVIEVLVAEGDTIVVEDALITLETDKATMDVPSTVAGTVRKLNVSVGDKVSEGDAVADVATAGKAGKAEAQQESQKQAKEPAGKKEKRDEADEDEPKSAKPTGLDPAPAAKPAGGGGELPPIDEAGFSKAHASPSVRKLARELGVDLAQVEGSGEKGRILHDDVKAFVKRVLGGKGAAPAAAAGGGALPAVPNVDFAKFGEVDEQALTRIQKISGPRLQASWINLPHVTQHDLADITELEARRQELKGAAKEKGISLTPLAFIMKACITALKEFPKVNASLSNDGTSLVYKKYYHLGFAADTEQGLVVPVIRDADRMDVYELATALGELSKAAREGKLKGDQMQGASFTISSLGGIGGTAFTPIVNAPEVGILGVSRSSMQPVWDGEQFAPRLMLPLSFSYDHRVIDGAYAVRFTTFLAEALGDVDKLLEAIP